MKLLEKIFQRNKKGNSDKLIDRKQQLLDRVGREQFIRLKEKGLSIPIFTL